jgi:integrase
VRQEATFVVRDDGPVGLDRVAVDFDDRRAVADAGIVLVATLAARLGIEALVDWWVRRSRQRCRPYDLRHAYVSLIIQAGHTVVEVARWAGHSPAVCLGTYAHLFDTASERMDPDQAIREARYGVRADERWAAG